MDLFPSGPSTTEAAGAFFPFIDPSRLRSLSADGIVQFIADRLSNGPVPRSFLIDLSRKSGFRGLPLMETAEEVLPGTDGRPSEGDGMVAGGAPVPSLEEAFRRIFDTLGEERGIQLEMAETIREAFEQGRTALIEAGTGTGKSLAYLVPAAIHSLGKDERIIISTHTRNLQEQLRNVEVPRLKEIVGIDIRVERLMGRENYICSKRLAAFLASLAEDDPGSALELGLRAAFSEDGEVEQLSSGLSAADRRALCAPARCRMTACPRQDRCPLVAVRKKARKAPILLVNHALAMTDFAQEGNIIGPYDGIVFDEAHRLEQSIVENLSVRIARRDVEDTLERVRPISPADSRWKHLGYSLNSAGHIKDWMRHVDLLSARAASLERVKDSFFTAISELLDPEGRLRSTRTRYADGASTFADLRDSISDYLLNIKELRDLFKPILKIDCAEARDFVQEIGFVDEDLLTLAEKVSYLTEASDEESVFWIEWTPSGGASALCGSPLEVGRRFADYLGERSGSAVFTSATLACGDSFQFFKERLGIGYIDRKPFEIIADSPFSFRENCRIVIQNGMGDPNSESFSPMVAALVGDLSRLSGRKVMALFTSYRSCRAVGECLSLMDLDGPVLVQGESGSRETISGRFREEAKAVLLGVASFWEGVDFPGEQLEILVIPKLPFPVPTEPVIEARSERIRLAGEDPFTKLHLPEAVLRLKQGAGRLIRRKGDRGAVVLLDSRIETRAYGPAFLSALPTEALRTNSAEETVERVLEWFR